MYTVGSSRFQNWETWRPPLWWTTHPFAIPLTSPSMAAMSPSWKVIVCTRHLWFLQHNMFLHHFRSFPMKNRYKKWVFYQTHLVPSRWCGLPRVRFGDMESPSWNDCLVGRVPRKNRQGTECPIQPHMIYTYHPSVVFTLNHYQPVYVFYEHQFLCHPHISTTKWPSDFFKCFPFHGHRRRPRRRVSRSPSSTRRRPPWSPCRPRRSCSRPWRAETPPPWCRRDGMMGWPTRWIY